MSSSRRNEIDLAFNHLYSHQFDAALEKFKELLNKSENLSKSELQSINYGKAKTLESMKHYEEAARIYQYNMFHFPHSELNYVRYTSCLLKLNQTDNALKIAKQNIRKFPNSSGIASHYISLLMKTGKLDLAEQEFNLFSKKFPTSAFSHFKHSELKKRQGKFKESFEEVEHIIKNYPINEIHSTIFYDYALKLKDQKKYAEALKILENLFKLKLPHVTVATTYAITLELNGEHNKAAKIYRESLERFPHDLQIHLTYAVFLQKKDQLKLAENEFHAILAKNAQFAPGLLGLSINEYENLNLASAIKLAIEAIKLNPFYDSAYSQIGHCYKLLAKVCVGSNNYYQLAHAFFEKAREIKESRINKHQTLEQNPLVSLLKNIEERHSMPAEERTKTKLSELELYYSKTKSFYESAIKTNISATQKQRFINLWKWAELCRRTGEQESAFRKLKELHSLLMENFVDISQLEKKISTDLVYQILKNEINVEVEQDSQLDTDNMIDLELDHLDQTIFYDQCFNLMSEISRDHQTYSKEIGKQLSEANDLFEKGDYESAYRILSKAHEQIQPNNDTQEIEPTTESAQDENGNVNVQSHKRHRNKSKAAKIVIPQTQNNDAANTSWSYGKTCKWVGLFAVSTAVAVTVFATNELRKKFN